MSDGNNPNVELNEDYIKLGEEQGGRKQNNHKTKRNNKNMIIVGKVYADWCGHCKSLAPEWNKMTKHIRKMKGKHNVAFVKIEEKQIEPKLRNIEKHAGVKIHVNGYPTLFRVSDGKVTYYNGNRTSEQMANWYLKGGEPNTPNMPALLHDVQGGNLRNFTHKRYRRNRNRYYHNRHNNYSRQYKGHIQINKTRKSQSSRGGIFDFLFGK
jgi:hypothetical protein